MADPRDLPPEAPPAGDFFAAGEPMALFSRWLGQAEAHEINDANAMALATTDADGLPNLRMVLLKDVSAGGFVFYTNTQSAKGIELGALGKAALLFHWKSLRRQVRVRGSVAAVTAAEADAYFATRPRGSRIGAWASQQSRPLPSRAVLEKAVADFAARYPGESVPRPFHWSGFRLTPLEIEFWHDRPFRLHDRLRFTRGVAPEVWTKERLFP